MGFDIEESWIIFSWARLELDEHFDKVNSPVWIPLLVNTLASIKRRPRYNIRLGYIFLLQIFSLVKFLWLFSQIAVETKYMWNHVFWFFFSIMHSFFNKFINIYLQIISWCILHWIFRHCWSNFLLNKVDKAEVPLDWDDCESSRSWIHKNRHDPHKRSHQPMAWKLRVNK